MSGQRKRVAIVDAALGAGHSAVQRRKVCGTARAGWQPRLAEKGSGSKVDVAQRGLALNFQNYNFILLHCHIESNLSKSALRPFLLHSRFGALFTRAVGQTLALLHTVDLRATVPVTVNASLHHRVIVERHWQ